MLHICPPFIHFFLEPFSWFLVPWDACFQIFESTPGLPTLSLGDAANDDDTKATAPFSFLKDLPTVEDSEEDEFPFPYPPQPRRCPDNPVGKKFPTYITPLLVMPWWRFFESWQLGISTDKILLEFFSKHSLAKTTENHFITKFWWRLFSVNWHFG